MRRFLTAALLMIAGASFGADTGNGRLIFQQRCSLCHAADVTDPDGEQGPRLQGVVGRPAASVKGFAYSKSLLASGLTWSPAELDRFLSAPSALVPGTNMPIAIADGGERADVVAYLASTHTPVQPTASANSGPRDDTFENWRADEPGHRQQIGVTQLPKPFAGPSITNRPRIVERPADAKLRVPAGFAVDAFATDVEGPRQLRVAPNGDVFVATTKGGLVAVLRTLRGASRASPAVTFAGGLKQPFGMAFYPSGNDPRWLYIAEENRVVRYAYRSGDLQARGEPQVVVADLLKSNAGHGSHDLTFSKDGKVMFVAAGSASDVAETMAKKSPEEVVLWEADHARGSTWDSEEGRGDILSFDASTGRALGPYATGIRNCGTLAIHPHSGGLWCVSTERNALGDDLAPDYLTRVEKGGFYGWPWYYIGAHEDPRHKGERPDLAPYVKTPDVLFTPHSAALSLAFYESARQPSTFPRSYTGNVFVAMHGSWNRGHRVGHKVVLVHVKNGVPTGEFEDFLTGFVVDDATAWGRPVAVAVARDGALLISDDASNTIWRVAHTWQP
jgi:glucose/arabinose dehydrogenase